MALPFLDCGARRLDQMMQRRLVCVFNLDSALAPPVRHPDEARLPLGILRRLTALSDHAPVGVITGRPVADVRQRLGFAPEFIVGNHGLEEDVFHLLPQGCGNKGAALEQMMRASGATGAIYIGDDISDEEVFRLRRSDLLTIRVGLEPRTAAEFFLPRRPGMAHVLDELTRKMRHTGMHNWMHAETAA